MRNYRIDQSENDGPYQGIHIYQGTKHVITFWEDDAPVHDFNCEQRKHAEILVAYMNGEYGRDDLGRQDVFNAFKRAKFI